MFIEDVTGDLEQIFGRHSWDYHTRIIEKYGLSIKFHGPVGANFLPSVCFLRLTYATLVQRAVCIRPEGAK